MSNFNGFPTKMVILFIHLF